MGRNTQSTPMWSCPAPVISPRELMFGLLSIYIYIHIDTVFIFYTYILYIHILSVYLQESLIIVHLCTLSQVKNRRWQPNGVCIYIYIYIYTCIYMYIIHRGQQWTYLLPRRWTYRRWEDRLEREYDLELIVTAPSDARKKRDDRMGRSPIEFLPPNTKIT